MSKKSEDFKENFQKLNDLSAKLQNTNVQDVSQIVQNLPTYIQEFKEVDDGVQWMMEELNEMEKLIQEKMN